MIDSLENLEKVDAFWFKVRNLNLRFFGEEWPKHKRDHINTFGPGHGPFRSYLVRFGLSDESGYRLCRTLQAETPEHLTGECERTRELMPINGNDVLESEKSLLSITKMIYRAEREISASELAGTESAVEG